MGRREYKKDLTRQQMLKAAADLFVERGYEATSVEDISERADVSKGTFYNHFDTKESLVIELRRSMLVGQVERVYALLDQGQSPVSVLETLLLERAAFTQKHPELAKVFFLQRIQVIFFKDEDLISRLDNDGKRVLLFRTAIYELVCEAQKRGQIRSDQSPSEITGMINACFLHAQGAWLASDRTANLVEKVHRWLHSILDGVGLRAQVDQAAPSRNRQPDVSFTPGQTGSNQGMAAR